MAQHKFQGNDRRLLILGGRLLEAVEKRDARAADPTPSKSLSTRLPIIDSATDGLPEAFARLQTLFANLQAAAG